MESEIAQNPMNSIIIGLIVILVIGILFWLRRKNFELQSTTKVESTKKDEIISSALIDESHQAIASTATTSDLAATDINTDSIVQLDEALKNTQSSFFGRIKDLFSSPNNDVLEGVEEILYTSDLGPKTVQSLLDSLKDILSKSEQRNISKVKETLKQEMNKIFTEGQSSVLGQSTLEERIAKNPQGPTVLMIVGVNGAGKTTSIGKISSQLAMGHKKVLVAAGDTFRAAAGGQLKVWTDRAGVEIFSPEGVADPSAVAFDGVSKAVAQNYDYVIVDTAGRLHTQANLMEELKKMKRVISKVMPAAPHEVWIVLDGNSGQNALMQAKEYHQALGLTGVVLTKMDGTAKGGVALGLSNELQIPLKLIGVGEKIQDLRLFHHEEFVDSILGR